jgi:hypothetical protein
MVEPKLSEQYNLKASSSPRYDLLLSFILTPEILMTCVQTFFSEASIADKIKALRTACDAHVKLTRECSRGLGQDRFVRLRDGTCDIF